MKGGEESDDGSHEEINAYAVDSAESLGRRNGLQIVLRPGAIARSRFVVTSSLRFSHLFAYSTIDHLVAAHHHRVFTADADTALESKR